jgi:hypothetical protein
MQALDRTSLALTSLSGDKTPHSQYVTIRAKFVSMQIIKCLPYSLYYYFSSHKPQQRCILKLYAAFPEIIPPLFYTGTEVTAAARKRQGCSKEIGEAMTRKWAEAPWKTKIKAAETSTGNCC